MRVLLNRLSNSRNITLRANNNTTNNFARTHVEGNVYRYTVTLGTEISSYTSIFLTDLVGQTITTSLWIRSSVDLRQAYLLGADVNQPLQKGVWKRLSFTLTVGENERLPGLVARDMQVGDYIDVREEYIVNAGVNPADIWLPALEDLPQEKRQLYPPSGIYSEITSI